MPTHTTQEVTCPKCYRVVHISPDRVRCEHCQANLQAMIAPDVARSYFYGRARQFFDQGDAKMALAEANRGLNQYQDSELRLLAAILARQLGELDQMRLHVAAIPIDDRLRKEAEWLLRSQYSPDRRRQRIESLAVLDEATDAQTPPAKIPSTNVFARSTGLKLLLGLLVTCSLLLLVWRVWQQSPQLSLNEPVTPIPNATAIPNATPTIDLLPVPTKEITEGIVQGNDSEENDSAIADTNPQAIVDGSTPYDLATMLNLAGKDELIASNVQARQREATLILNGTVAMAAERQALIEFAQTLGGISEVDALALQVRTPPTYTVQSGDTLWSIAFKFYGDDSQRIAQIFEANRAIMNSANDLRLGMELSMPAYE